MQTALIFAALPEEYRYLLRSAGPWRLVCRRPFRMFRRSFAGREWRLVETGMGRDRITRALAWAVQERLPAMVLSIGFCGSLSAALPVGSVVLGQSFQFLQSLEERCEAELIGYAGTAGAIDELCRAVPARCAPVVTLPRPQAKTLLRRRFLAAATVIDMESYFVAGFARDRGLPFFCLRAVSDAAQDEIGFDLDSISSNGRVRILKVVALLSRRPNLLPVFYCAWKRSRLAARQLARAFMALMQSPALEAAKLAPAARSATHPENP